MSRLNQELSKLNMKKKYTIQSENESRHEKIFHQRRNTDNKYTKKLKSLFRKMHIKTMMEISLYIYLNY